MGATEETQYTIICKERFTSIEQKLDRNYEAINGKNGLNGRLIRVEDTVITHSSRWKWIFCVMAVIVAAVIVGYLKG